MPDPNRLLSTLEQARMAFLRTPGRIGHSVQLQNAEEVLVAGDLHGNLENLRRILVLADLGKFPRRHLVLQEVVHGPFAYPDGSDKSHQLVDLVAALKCQFPERFHFLLGNHELAQWTNQWIAKSETNLNENFRAGVGVAYGSFADAIYAAYLALFAVAPVAILLSNRGLLTHSLPSGNRLEAFEPARLHCDEWEDADLRPGGSVYSLVWGRDVSATNVEAFLKKMNADWLITGHIPCDTGFTRPNERQIIVDAKGLPAGYCLLPAEVAVTPDQLESFTHLLA
jgi:hypothetical protein